MADAILERRQKESVPYPPDPTIGSPVRLRWIAVLALFVAIGARLPYFINLAVPLNDGGMFAQIVDELRANGLRMPTRTGYNGLNIPLSYPPLGFYAAAIFGNITGLPSAEVLKGLPLFFNLLSVLAFVALAARILHRRVAIACAAITFAIIPQSGGWLIMGGGLTRSIGFFFSILAFIAAYDTLHRARRRDVVATGLFAAAAGLSHLESGTLVCLVLPLFGIYYGPVRQSLARLLPAAGLAILATVPWLLWLRANVGLEPLRNASQTGGALDPLQSLIGFAQGKILTDRFMGLGALLLPGMIWALRKRRWLLPAWILLVMVLVSRSAYTQVSVPACLMVGETWAAMAAWTAARKGWLRPRIAVGTWLAAMTGLAVWTGIDKYIYGYPLPAYKYDVLGALSETERRAMVWCRSNTPPDARFVVISERMDNWYMDMAGEWFPYFAQRRSVLTVQGREWRPSGEFTRWKQYLQGTADLPQLRQMDRLMRNAGLRYDYVFVTGPLYNPRANLAREISRDSGFETVYEKRNIRVYRAKSLRP